MPTSRTTRSARPAPWLWLLWCSLWLSGAPLALGAEFEWDDDPEFLPVDEAFVLSTETGTDGALLAYWNMPDGYYLYRHQFDFEVREGSGVTLGQAEIPPGLQKVDEYFGAVEVYYHDAQVRVPISADAGSIEIGISYQGCADAGLCYPPETKWVVLNVAASGGAAGPGGGEPLTAYTIPATEERQLASLLTGSSMLVALMWFFIGGIGLAFTPCVLPMVPILSSIIVGDSENLNRVRAFTLSTTYVLGMALTYALVGTLVGLFGASLNLQASLQSAPVLIGFAAVFVVLSFAMFGFYELQLPQSWQNALNTMGDKWGGGKHAGVFVMGSLSSLIVSPCVSAPLAGALIYLSTTGDAVLGGSALLALGLGMGVPLIILGSSGGHLLPKAGAWMNAVKTVFGVLLLAVAIWLLERVIPAAATLGLWAALLIGSGVYLGALDGTSREGWGQLWKASGVFGIVYGALLLIGAASGAQDPLKPLQQLAGGSGQVFATSDGATEGQLRWQPVRDLPELKHAIAEGTSMGRPVLLDLYADWCISCKVMERSVFPKPEVASQLAQFYLVRADVTANNAADKALMNEYGLFGPPSMVFFAEDGRELTEIRVQGEIGAEALAAHLQAILGHLRAQNFAEKSGNFGETAAI